MSSTYSSFSFSPVATSFQKCVFSLVGPLRFADIPHVDKARTHSGFLIRCVSPRQHFFQGDLQEMQQNRAELSNLLELRRFVSHTLCQRNDIEVGIFQVTERLLTRRGRPCGMYFCLHGPRSVKLTAVWETDKNTILFYGSTGEKFLKTRLTQAPAISTPD